MVSAIWARRQEGDKLWVRFDVLSLRMLGGLGSVVTRLGYQKEE